MIMRLIVSVVVVLAGSLMADSCAAYREPTHERISAVAFDQAVLARSVLNEELLLDLTRIFVDGELQLTPREWLQYGSVHEDDRGS